MKIYENKTERSLHVCIVNIKVKYNFVETPRTKLIIAELSIRKLEYSSVLMIMPLLLLRAYGSEALR